MEEVVNCQKCYWVRVKMIRYTKEQREFLITNNYMTPAKNLAIMFNDEFGTNITETNIKSFRGNNHLNSGLTGRFERGHIPKNKGKSWNDYMSKEAQEIARRTTFKKSNIPHNHKPIGYERVNVDGYVEVKTQEPNVFELKHRIVYEQTKGPIPNDCNVAFADGNKSNLDPDNLILVTKSEMLVMNKKSLFKKDRELTKTGHLIAKVIDKQNKLKRG